MAQAHGNLGLLLREQKRLPEAVASLRRAVELEPRNLVRRRNLRETLGRLVPAWHLPMLNDLRRATLSPRVSPEEFEGLSEDLTVFSMEAPFHFDPPEHFSIDFEVVRAGRCYGVLQWIRILLDEKISIINDPRVERAGSVSHWNQLVYPFERPLDLAAGQGVRVFVASTGSALAFGLPEIL
jgi:hypothetical protein